jgi:hypothetical protein
VSPNSLGATDRQAQQYRPYKDRRSKASQRRSGWMSEKKLFQPAFFQMESHVIAIF